MESVVIPLLFFVVTGGLFFLFEMKFPIRSVNRRATLGIDLFMIAWSLSLSGLILLFGESFLPSSFSFRLALSQLENWQRFVIFFVLSDLSKYLFHVFMHLESMWRTHRLHHSPKSLHWMSGNRASLLMLLLHFGPIGIFAWILSIPPEWAILSVCLNILWNHLMHTNIKIGDRFSRLCEYLIVTPRYHHIHHGIEKRFANKNFASILTIWDRLFSTYFNPDHVDPNEIQFGDGSANGEELSWKALIGY